MIFEIPAYTTPARCRSCQQVVYWITTRAGKKMPVTVERANPEHRYPDDSAGRGVSHFAVCPHAQQHRRKPDAP